MDLKAADAITEFCIKFPNGNEIEAPLKTANAKQVNIIGWRTKWLLTNVTWCPLIFQVEAPQGINFPTVFLDQSYTSEVF